MSAGPSVVLGVGGGIAAYKAVALLRLLAGSGADVHVVPTASALRFVGEPTWASLSRHPVRTDVWTGSETVPHVAVGRAADLVVVAPATADLLARAAHGLADDLLTNVLLTARCPVLMAPAMHTEMWEHPATRANVATLRERGVHVIDPADGPLAGADSGPGRLPEPEVVHAAALALLDAGAAEGGDARGPDLSGRRVVVSAGGTREALDPVRYLGNASSGRQGVALAETARDLGAHVVLVAGHVEVPLPAGVEVRLAPTAARMREAVLAAVHDPGGCDALVMAAAVADFRPEAVSDSKIKKGAAPPVLRLVPTADILAEVSRARPDPGTVVVGFAAETGDADGDVLDHARRKLAAKGCDLLVVNDVSGGRVFGEDTTRVLVLHRDAAAGPDGGGHSGADWVAGSKREVSTAVWEAVARSWAVGAARPDLPS